MSTVAIIGVDGAGKTTICKKLIAALPIPTKYLYMGINIESSNFALPTSRLMLAIKLRSYRKTAKKSGFQQANFVSTHNMVHRVDRAGKIKAVVRLCNRLAEAWYRQIISWYYQLRGYIVVYDRYFLFDLAPSLSKKSRLTHRIHHWIIHHLFPQPNLIIFLEAPPEVLFNRQQETTLEYLRERQIAFLEQGKSVSNFIRVDANQPLDKVYEVVHQHIMEFYSSKHHKQFYKEN